ncbi:MAG: polyprenyl synthetase family protein [Desulfuromonadales bacterium]|nr:polyprenyl synthetase family protein [Desulfuromonadales bacterium]
MIDLKTYRVERIALVDAALDQFLPTVTHFPGQLHEAMRYSVFAGGKRIRPILALAACEAVGGEVSVALPLACALEMIHTYSLIHDDLPAMDDDDLRRGRPTNHKIFGEATAILAGDALQTEAFALLADEERNAGLSAQQRCAVIELIARSAGAFGMVAGQMADMEAEGDHQVDLPSLEFIHTHKTGKLIVAALQAGALAGGATAAQLTALTRYGEAAGLAFQVADDVLDVIGDQAEIGKDVGSDIARGKATYVALLGLSEARRRADDLRQLAIDALQSFGTEAEPLRKIATYMVDRTS